MITRILLLLTIITSNLINVTALDPVTLLDNGKAAQKLNLYFQTLNVSEPCISGSKACISDAVASCEHSKWSIGQGTCSKNQGCFALPSGQKMGTLVTCTTQTAALSAIGATGATGGIFGDLGSSSNSTSTDDGHHVGYDNPNCSDDNETRGNASTTLVKTSSVPNSTGASTQTLTITVTLGTEPTTLPPTTRTLSPDQASRLLSELIANGATLVTPSSVSATSS